MSGIQNGPGPQTPHSWPSPQEQVDPVCRFHKPRQLQSSQLEFLGVPY